MTESSEPQRDATSRRRFLAAAGTAAAIPAAAALLGSGHHQGRVPGVKSPLVPTRGSPERTRVTPSGVAFFAFCSAWSAADGGSGRARQQGGNRPPFVMKGL